MNVIKATVFNGRIETDHPIDLPNGTEFLVRLPAIENQEEDGWDNSPEGIASWLKWYDSLEPLIFTDEELAALTADKQARRKWEEAHFEEHAEKLAREWQ